MAFFCAVAVRVETSTAAGWCRFATHVNLVSMHSIYISTAAHVAVLCLRSMCNKS